MTTILAQLSDPHIRVGPDDQGSAAALANAVETLIAPPAVADRHRRPRRDRSARALGGCAVVTCPSTNWQAKLEIGSPGFSIAPEPPAFLVHTADVAHVQPV